MWEAQVRSPLPPSTALQALLGYAAKLRASLEQGAPLSWPKTKTK